MKLIKRLILLVILLGLGVGFIVYKYAGSIIRAVVQEQATASLNVPTSVGGANLSLMGGSVSLSDLQIASPPKFQAPRIFTLGGVSVQVDYSQLKANPIHIKKVVLDSPNVVVERQGTTFNFQALMDGIPQAPKSSDGTAKEPLKLIIDELQMNNATVVFQTLPGLDKPLMVPVGSMTLKNIGSGEGNQNGAALKDVAMIVITSLTSKASDIGKLPGNLGKMLQEGIGPVTSKFSSNLQGQLRGLTKSLPLDAGSVIDQATGKGGLGDLLGGAKKKEKN